METTKEKILKEAGKLFSEFGFSDVSMEILSKNLISPRLLCIFISRAKRKFI